jgi:LPXTG-site transpeptidase (sortase) family protein
MVGLLIKRKAPMSYTLTDQEIRMFLREAPTRPTLRRAASFVAGPLIAALILVSAFNYLRPTPTMISENQAILPVATTTAPIADVTPAPQATAVPTATPLPVTIPNNTFAAGDVNIAAPILWDVAFDDTSVNKALQNGVIHIAGTALPGQNGTIAIAGHSSNYPWIKGDFNSIFAPLTKMKPGQLIEVNYEGTMYHYNVTRVYEVSPNDLSVLKSTGKAKLVSITCTPVGTSLRRLIVEADQIFPDPGTNKAFNGSDLNGSLPGDQ